MVLDIDDGASDSAMTQPASARPSPIEWLPRSLIRRWQALRQDRQRRAISRYLDRMSDHALRDIGMDRSEITMMARDLSERLSSRRRP